jgi:DNA-binding transcriptional LysR family regulator
MNWNDLRFVLAVSQARSFLGAAKVLRVTHTTVSRRIGALETTLGSPLFLRESNLCVPTPACARLVIAATRMEEVVRAAGKGAVEVADTPSGDVYISTVHWIINEVLLPAGRALQESHPNIRLRFYGGLYDGPRDGAPRLLSLRFELKQARGEEVIPVARIGYAVYAPAACSDPQTLPWISFGGSLPMAWLEARGVPATAVSIMVGDASAVMAAVEAGLGRGLMPECLGDRNPGLQRLSGPRPEFVRLLRIVGDWSEIGSPRCQAVIAWIEQAFEGIGCGMRDSLASLGSAP